MSTTSNSNRSKAQASEIAYNLHTLGWKAFQNLCVTITSELWGQTVQSFFDSEDGGRDGAFRGVWKSKRGESFEGSFTVQCKFTAKADKQLQLSDLKDELKKAKRLAERGLSDNYFLFTNARLTGTTEEKISNEFKKVSGIKSFSAYGCERISLFIHEYPRLRMLVPRVYGLGDLSQILDERACDQAKEVLSALGDDLAKFVITEAYQHSAKALVKHGFVLLLGEPACGKSTIAAALAIGALDNWGCATFKIRDADDFIAHSNPHEPKQFFWVDDAFGATQFEQSSVAEWNKVFPHMYAAIKRGARILFTSRDYIYNSARQHLKESAFPVLRESQVVIQVEKLSKDEREQILYNHIRLGNQPRKYKNQIKPFLSDVAANTLFSPEIARRLGDPLFTRHLIISKSGLDEFVDHPVDLLCEIIRTIDKGSQSALALVFMRGGLLPCPIEMTADEEHAIALMGGSSSDVRNALNCLNRSLVLQFIQGGVYLWQFKHPTIRDAFAIVIAEDHELMDIYMAGAPVDRLFSEVTCGDVGIQGVKVIVPPDRYNLIIKQLSTIDTFTPLMVKKLHRFLAFRCDSDFLSLYISKYPNFIPGLRVCSYLDAISDVDVLVRLQELGLLPESKRVTVATAIHELAIVTPDAGFLREGVRNLLTPDEKNAIIEDIRKKLLPDIDSTIQSWRDNFSINDQQDPGDYFYELVRTFEDYRDEIPDSAKGFETALVEVNNIIEDLRADYYNDCDNDYEREEVSSNTVINHGSRSIFDDVDQ